MLDQDLRPVSEGDISNLRGTLATLAREQRAEFGDIPKLPGEGLQLLADFTQTDAFRNRCLQLISYLNEPKDDDQLRDISHRFSGAIFQDIASIYLAQNIPEDLMLLYQDLALISPKRTHEFFEELYPVSGETLPFEDGPLPERGVRFPDGLFVTSDDSVVAICEYTLIGNRPYFVKKKEGLDKIKEDYRGIFGETDHVVVVYSLDSRRHTEGIDFTVVPLDHTQFREFIDKAYEMLLGNYMGTELTESVKDKLKVMRSFTLNRSTDPKYPFGGGEDGSLSR